MKRNVGGVHLRALATIHPPRRLGVCGGWVCVPTISVQERLVQTPDR
jgi:hypothetical protein